MKPIRKRTVNENSFIDIAMDKLKNIPLFNDDHLNEAMQFIKDTHNTPNRVYAPTPRFYATSSIKQHLEEKYYMSEEYSFSAKFVRLASDYVTPIFEINVLKVKKNAIK